MGANVLSVGSTAGAEALQGAEIHQGITGDATANAHQVSGIDQGTQPAGTGVATPAPTTPSGAMDGNLLNVNVDLNGNLKLDAPIDGAVAANVNAAAPIDAAASANVGSVDSHATAISHQEALITQQDSGDATATGTQDSTINQP